MTKKEFDSIIPRLESRFFDSSFNYYYVEPFQEFCLHPFVWVDGDYFICMKWRKIVEMQDNINSVSDNDIFYIHYRYVQKLRGLNEYNLKWITCWNRKESKMIPHRKIKIGKILKQL